MKSGRHAAPTAPSERLHLALTRGAPVDAATERSLLLVEQLRTAGNGVQPTAEFRAALRARLMTAAPAEEHLGTVLRLPVATSRRFRLGGRLAFLAAAVAATAVAVSAVLLLPPAGRPPSADAASARLAAAEVGIDDLRPLIGRSGQTAVPPVLDSVDTSVRDGTRMVTTAAVARGDGRALMALALWAQAQRNRLTSIGDAAGGPARSRVQASVTLLARVETRAGVLAGLVGVPCLRHPVFDDLGPVPCAGRPTPSPTLTASVLTGHSFPSLDPVTPTGSDATGPVTAADSPQETPPPTKPAQSEPATGQPATPSSQAGATVVVEVPGVGPVTLSPLWWPT